MFGIQRRRFRLKASMGDKKRECQIKLSVCMSSIEDKTHSDTALYASCAGDDTRGRFTECIPLRSIASASRYCLSVAADTGSRRCGLRAAEDAAEAEEAEKAGETAAAAAAAAGGSLEREEDDEEARDSEADSAGANCRENDGAAAAAAGAADGAPKTEAKKPEVSCGDRRTADG